MSEPKKLSGAVSRAYHLAKVAELSATIQRLERDRDGLVPAYVRVCDKVDQLRAELTSTREQVERLRPALRQTRFEELDSDRHPLRKWWSKHGHGRLEFIWACRGWIAREQMMDGVSITGDSLMETKSPGIARDAALTEPAATICEDCNRCARRAYSDATTPGFFYDKCERHRAQPAAKEEK